MNFLVGFTIFLITQTSFGKKNKTFSIDKSTECFERVKKSYINQGGNPSDVPYEFSFDKTLLAREPVMNYQKKPIATYQEDKLIYKVTGSYHSGYFIDVIVVNIENCETLDIYNIYSE